MIRVILEHTLGYSL